MKVILLIAETGSITEAAKKLFVSQSSLSQTLKQVEDDLAVSLFRRENRTLKLTDAGNLFVNTARKHQAIDENFKTELHEIKAETRGVLRFGISPSSGVTILPIILPLFVRKYPNVRIELMEAGSILLESAIQDKKLDLAFVASFPASQDLEYTLLWEQTVKLIAAMKSKIAQRIPPNTPISLIEAKDDPFVSLTKTHSIRQLQDQLCYSLQFHPQILFETGNIEAALKIAIHCDAVALCPNTYLNLTKDENGNSLCVEYDLASTYTYRHFYACFRADYKLPQYAKYLIDLTRALQPR